MIIRTGPCGLSLKWLPFDLMILFGLCESFKALTASEGARKERDRLLGFPSVRSELYSCLKR